MGKKQDQPPSKLALIIRCKDCGVIFFACAIEARLFREAAKDIAEYILAGHKLEVVDTSVVRVQFNYHTCGIEDGHEAEANDSDNKQLGMEI